MASKKRTVSEIMKTEKAEEVEKKGKEISSWIEAQLKEKLPKPNLRESLLDGVVLCKLINALAPGALKRYHKKPRMLAMKIENIGFFLATCKTRMNLPPALLFQPTDIHDDSNNNLASMSKVLNVLSFLKGDGEGDMIQALPDDDDDEDGAKPDAEKAGTGAAAEADTQEPEPEPEPEPIEEPEPPAPAPTPVPTPVTHHAPAAATQVTSHAPAQATSAHATPHATSHAPASTNAHASASTNAHASASTNAHASASTNAHAPVSTNAHPFSDSDYAEVQTEVLKAISEVINAELSIESKRKLVKILQQQITSFEEKIMNSTDEQLVALVKELGIEEVPKAKGREGSIEILLKYGRVH